MGEEYTHFVAPGDMVYGKEGLISGEEPSGLPQMPAYHLCRPDGHGITLVNIGVGRQTPRRLRIISPCCVRIAG